MLNITPIKTGGSAQASGAAEYYLKEEAHLDVQDTVMVDKQAGQQPEGNVIHDYGHYVLAESGPVGNQAVWHGQLAEQTGLAGQPVTTAQLSQAFAGQLNGEQVPQRQDGMRRGGYDLTFSAPKGASIMALVGGDERIQHAHQQAVKSALDEAARIGITIRHKAPDTGRMMQTPTDQVMFALTTHKTSRSLDPELHTHAILPNMTRDTTGKLRALTADSLYENSKYIGMVYQADLNKSLQAMGYSTRSLGNGQYDISGLDQKLLDQFSNRRHEILEQLEQTGQSSGKARDVAALSTRDAKQYEAATESDLLQEWAKQAEPYNLGDKVRESRQNTYQKEPETLHKEAQQALNKAVSHISHYQTRFNYNQLLQRSLNEFSPENAVSIGDLKQALDTTIKDGHLIPLDQQGTQVTSPQQIEQEKRLQHQARQSAQTLSTPVNQHAIQQLGLTRANEQAITNLFNSTRQTNMLTVDGSAREPIQALLHAGENAGQNVKVLTPNNYHLQTSRQHAKRQSFGIYQWLRNQFRDKDYVQTLGSFLHQQSRNNTLDRDHLIVVDQADKLSLPDTEKLLQTAQQGQAKVILLNQEQGRSNTVTAGNVTETLQQGQIQTAKWQQQQQRSTTMAITAISQDHERRQAIAREYANLAPDQKDQTRVIAASTREERALNQTIRDTLQASGQLSQQSREFTTTRDIRLSREQQTIARNYQAGMELTFFTNDQSARHYTVTGINARRNTVQTVDSKGRTGEFDPARNHNPMRITTRQSIAIAPGESLFVQRSDGEKLKAGTGYTVTDVKDDAVKIQDSEANNHTLHQSELARASIVYDYARTLNQHAYEEPKNIITGVKQYAFNKELAAELMLKSQDNLKVYTDDAQKLHRRMKQSGIQPSAMTTVLNTRHQELNRYVDHTGRDAIYRDTREALQALQADYNKDTLSKSVDHAIHTLSERQAAFRHQDMVQTALQHAFQEYGHAANVNDIKNQLNELQNQGKLIAEPGGTRWTTPEAVQLEQAIIQQARDGRDQVAPLATNEQVQNHLQNGEGANLTNGQQEAVTAITTTTDRFIAIQGYAGTGKSTMLAQGQALVHQAEQSLTSGASTQFVGLAPTHQAVKELSDKGIPAQTSKSLLFELSEQARAGDTPDHSNRVYLLDESSMVSNRDFRDFMQMVQATNARAVFLGDIQQLQSLEAGAPFKLLTEHNEVATTYMPDIRRQQDPAYRQAVESLIQDKPYLADQFLQQQEGHTRIAYQHNANSQKNGSVQEVANPRQLTESVAREYLARTPATREQTLIVANTHEERQAITRTIRDGLKQEGTLGSETLTMPQLSSLNKTPAEMGAIDSYEPGQIMQMGQHNFYEVQAVDKQHKTVNLHNPDTGQDKVIAPGRMNHRFNGLYQQQAREVAVNDALMMKRTDHSKGIMANDRLKVQEIDASRGTVALGNDQKNILLERNKLADMVWDYSYTQTTYSAQGTTYPFVLSVDQSNNPLVDQLSDYVKKSRGSTHLMVFTDNREQYLKQVAKAEGGNVIATQLTGKSPGQQSDQPGTKPVERSDDPFYEAKANPRYLNAQGQFDIRLYGQDVARELTRHTEDVVKHYMGEPNQARSTNQVWAYGRDSASFKVTMNGENRGKWVDWATRERGDLITLIMRETGQKYSEAVREGASMINMPETLSVRDNDQPAKQSDDTTTSKAEAYGKRLWGEGQSIDHTLAETYLQQHRGITAWEVADLRYHNRVYTRESSNTYEPALLAAFRDSKGHLQSIEAIYLDRESAGQADLAVAKRSYGSKQGGAITLSHGHQSERNLSVVTEGVATGLSLKQAMGNEHIVATGGKDNMANLEPDRLHDNVVIGADYDGHTPEQDTAIQNAITRLEEAGKNVALTWPDPLNDTAKTDFNDVLREQSETALADQLNQKADELEQTRDINRTLVDQVTEQLGLTPREVREVEKHIDQTGENRLDELLTYAENLKYPDSQQRQPEQRQQEHDDQKTARLNRDIAMQTENAIDQKESTKNQERETPSKTDISRERE